MPHGLSPTQLTKKNENTKQAFCHWAKDAVNFSIDCSLTLTPTLLAITSTKLFSSKGVMLSLQIIFVSLSKLFLFFAMFLRSYVTPDFTRGCQLSRPSQRNRCQHDALCPIHPSDAGSGSHVVRAACSRFHLSLK